MKKVIIEFEYDETVDGELTPSDWDRIIEFLTRYGHDVKVREVEECIADDLALMERIRRGEGLPKIGK